MNRRKRVNAMMRLSARNLQTVKSHDTWTQRHDAYSRSLQHVRDYEKVGWKRKDETLEAFVDRMLDA